MKSKVSVFFVICSLVLVFLAGTVFAATGYVKEITASMVSDIKFEVDGKEVTPRDVNGNVSLPIIYEGRTYLPVRSIGELLNYRVNWINEKRMVTLMNPNYVPALDNDMIPEIELNDSQSAANMMPLNSKIKGEVWGRNQLTGEIDRQDYFRVILINDGELKLTLNVENATIQPYLKIFEEGKSTSFKSETTGDSNIREMTLSLKAGTYFVYVGTNTDKTTYTLENSFK